MNRLKSFSFLSLLVLICFSSGAFAWRGGGGHGGGGYYHGGGYGYHGGPYYSTVFVGGVPYYFYDGVYYDYQGGYVVPAPVMVVPSPMVLPPDQPIEQPTAPVQRATVSSASAGTQESIGDTVNVTLYIPHSGGKYNSIKLVKCKNGYLGPMGEFYPGHPTVAQLQALYGN